MKRLPTAYKDLLLKIAKIVQEEIKNKIPDERVQKVEELKVCSSDTFGYYVQIFSFKRIKGRGKIELWLDFWANPKRPTLCVCFWSSDLSRIYQIIKSSISNYYDDHPKEIKKFNNGSVLAHPLTRKHYEKFLVEPYNTNYLSYFFINEIGIRNSIAQDFITKVIKQTTFLIKATILALEIPTQDDKEFSAYENRQVVKEHKLRERSQKLAEVVKKRDNYTCQVCGFNAFNFYGIYGMKVAEAHHIISLSQLKTRTKTTKTDMITVCPNCHRVLHRMEGKADDYRKLKKIVYNKHRE